MLGLDGGRQLFSVTGLKVTYGVMQVSDGVCDASCVSLAATLTNPPRVPSLIKCLLLRLCFCSHPAASSLFHREPVLKSVAGPQSL